VGQGKSKEVGGDYPEVYENTGLKPGAYATLRGPWRPPWLLTGKQEIRRQGHRPAQNLAPYSFAPEALRRGG